MSEGNDIAIQVDHLTKAYKLYNKPVDRMKESLHPFRKRYHHDFYALNDVSFEVKKGETVGIIGKNGSGKSTLLKIITGVLTPTSGNVQVDGKVSALLELGAGFNPEFTGVENVYFNGSIMGYTRAEMDSKIDDILSFADIGEFADQPVKVYSSGMFVRLAFAVAINVDPEILIVDEALSVGDAFFQQKCSSFMKENFKYKTKVLVSHDIYSIITLSDRVILLDYGKIIYNGDPEQAAKIYTKLLFDLNKDVHLDNKSTSLLTKTYDEVSDVHNKCKWVDVETDSICGSGKVNITNVSLTDENWKNVSVVKIGDIVYINIIIESKINSNSIIAGYLVRDRLGVDIFGETSKSIPRDISITLGRYLIRYRLKWPSIKPGFYTITPGIGEGEIAHGNFVHSWAQNCILIENVNPNSILSIFNHDIIEMTVDKI